MTKLFTSVVNMSITASFVVLAVIVIRLCLKKAPKIYSYLLWIAVLIRFLIPVSFEAGFGIVPSQPLIKTNDIFVNEVTTHSYVPNEKINEEEEKIQEGSLTEEEIQYLPVERIATEVTYTYDMENMEDTAATFHIPAGTMKILAVVWFFAGICLILYEAVSYGNFMQKLRRESGTSIKEEGKRRDIYIWISNAVKTPFVAGFFSPVIYLPENLEAGQRELIMEHEKIHIRRLDHIIKPAAMLVCCIYWFNPFAWLAFYLMERDMESSCDEAVLRKIGYDRKKEYAGTLLSLAVRETWRPGHPISFGESNVKSRIKHAVKIKKASVFTSAAGAVTAVFAVFFLLANRTEAAEEVGEIHLRVENTEVINEMLQMDEIQDAVPERVEEKGISGVPGTDENDASVMEFVSPDGYVRNTNYDPLRDQFEILLLTSVEDHQDVEILFSYPVEYSRISDDFGTRIHPITQKEKVHSGIDFAADKGTPVTAAADGVVAETGYDQDCGNYIILQHSNGDMTYYAACEEILAEEGKNVKRGEMIATVGSTGRSTGSHLHFAVSRDGNYIEPQFIDSEEETTDFISPDGNSAEGMSGSVEKLVDKYKEYGLSAEYTDDDYQLYFEEEPVYFFADNRNFDGGHSFSGTLFAKVPGEENGYTGVVTRYDKEKRMIGLERLSEEESKAFSDRYIW